MEYCRKSAVMLVLMLLCAGLKSAQSSDPCIRQDFSHSSFVCVCNGTYCDNYGLIEELIKPDEVLLVTSDLASKRFEVSYASFGASEEDPNAFEYILDESQKFQEILGFGGAFTDSAGFNIQSMPEEEARNKIIEAYYAPTGLDYSIGRLNIGGCDFSSRH